MPFSVSIGDAIACATLVKNVVGSLKSGAGSSLVYQELLAEFQILDLSFLVLERSKLDDIPEAKTVLSETVANCKRNIEQFLSKNQKFAAHLKEGGSSSSFKDALRKVQWTLFRDEDVKDIRLKMQLHLSTIDALLSMCQNAMLCNLAQHTVAQHQKLAERQLEYLDNQRRTNDLVMENQGNTLLLRADLQNLSRSTGVCRSRPLPLRRRRPGPLGQRQITEAEFAEAFATGKSSTIPHAIGTSSNETNTECHPPAHDSISKNLPQHQICNLPESASNDPPRYRLAQSRTRIQRSMQTSSQRRLIDQRWKSLGAWLSVVTYQEHRYLEFPNLTDLTRDQRQTVLEISLLSRILCARLQFTYGDFQGTNGVSMSLSIPRILLGEHRMNVWLKLKHAPLDDFIEFFQIENYHATDFLDEHTSLLQCAVAFRRPQIYQFLINQGAKVDAGGDCDVNCLIFASSLYEDESNVAMLEVMEGEFWDGDLHAMGSWLWWNDCTLPDYLQELKDLQRHDLICDMNVYLEGYLNGYCRRYFWKREFPCRNRQELIERLEWVMQRGVNPYTYYKMPKEVDDAVPRITLTYIAFVYKALGPWFRILLRSGHNPVRAFRDSFHHYIQKWSHPESLRAIPGSLKHLNLPQDLTSDFYQALLYSGYESSTALKIVYGEEKIPHELPGLASGTDYESSLLAQYKQRESGNVALVERRRRPYEED